MATLIKVWTFIKSLPRFGKEILAGLIAILVIIWEASGKKKAQQNADVANAEKTDAVDAQKQEDIKKQDQQVQQQGEEAKKQVSDDPNQIAKDLNNV